MWALALLLAGAGSARAGWEIEQTTYNLRSSGKEIGRSPSTLRISKDRVRTSDGTTVSIYDYDKGRVLLLLPEKKLYWDGTVDEYLSAVRAANPNRRGIPGELKQPADPPLLMQETPITADIAGKQTKKYVVQVDGRPYQEIWVAPDFLGDDLDLKRYHETQRKIAQSVRSSYATNLRALSDNELYKKIVVETYPMRTNTYLGEAIIGTEVVRISKVEVPDSDFAVPNGFTRTPLTTLIEAQQAISDRGAAEQRKKAEADMKKAPPKTKGKTPAAKKK